VVGACYGESRLEGLATSLAFLDPAWVSWQWRVQSCSALVWLLQAVFFFTTRWRSSSHSDCHSCLSGPC
jgi:hypothetical protein